MKNIRMELDKYDIIKYNYYEVPGSFEIPHIVDKICEKYNNDNKHIIVCLGAIIKGETAHFEYISSSVINGLM
jgi:6,7-dimethyl-8-ribityllumazine synthase